MKGELRNILKVASIYMATIIGAGFASGQEIVQFFSAYYQGGFYGILLAGFLFSVIGYIVLDKVYRERIRSYDEFLFPTLGWFMGWIMELVVTLFMISLFSIMVAGAGNITVETFSIPYEYAIILTTVLCMVFIITDIKGVVALSTFVTPFLIAGIIIVGFYIIIFKDTTVFNLSEHFAIITNNWFFSALLYVSYNSILSVVVMCSLLPYLTSRRVGIAGGVLGGLMLCAIAFVLNVAIILFSPESLVKELPVLSIVEKYGSFLSNVYTFILWLAMVLSAVTSGYCFVNRICSKTGLSPRLLTVIMCAVVVPMSSFGFSSLITTVYPIFGYMGLFMVFIIIFQGVRQGRQLIKKRQRLF